MPVLESSETQIKSTEYWRLSSENGRQRWLFNEAAYQVKYPGDESDPDPKFLDWIESEFIFDKSANPNSSDRVYRSAHENSNHSNDLPDWLKISSNFRSSLNKKANSAAFKGIRYYQQLQAEDGHWPGDYGGPLFLLPGLIIISHVTDTPFTKVKQKMMECYMLNHQNDDGGWGLHIEGESTMFGTVMQYCALRILGITPESKELTLARNWVLENGGAVGIPSWGKFFLSVLGVYEWKGCNSLLPEMWLLPKWLPIHPWRYWCHARMVYLPMSNCYASRVTPRIDSLTAELRQELYKENYDSINWSDTRNTVCAVDQFYKLSTALKWSLRVINGIEAIVPKWLRSKAIKYTISYINAEDHQTKFIDIGPVNQIINSLAIYHTYGRDSDQFKAHVDRWDDYLWIAEDGMKMSGYNGSQLWDTAFAAQALLENEVNLIDHNTIQKAYSYINGSQITEEVKDREKFFRHQSLGGWPFSTLDHGWPISDCTAEGLKAAIKCHQSEYGIDLNSKIPDSRLNQAVDVILSLQNKDGGWATYENTRSSPYLELLNPSEVFGKIMVDYSWVECTSACVTALNTFKDGNSYHSEEVQTAIYRGLQFIHKMQRDDGSWIGSWGVCFTYGTWFGIEALTSSEKDYSNSEEVKKACHFLIDKQHEDGGWGESHLSCVNDKFEETDSQVVNTSWALLSLMAAKYPDSEPIKTGIEFLINRQLNNGDWDQEQISGVFNQNCMITYTSYRNVFPLWAIGRYLRLYGDHLNYRGSQISIK